MKKPKTVAERLTKALLEKLRTRKLTNMEAAEQLGCSETYLSRIVAAQQDKVPGTTMQEREAAAKIYKARKEIRAMWAKRVLRKRATLEQAAHECGCSVRTVFRWIAQYRT